MAKHIKKSLPRDSLEQAFIVHRGWKEFKDQLDVPNFSLEDFEQKIEEVKKKIELAEKIRRERSQAVEIRNIALNDLWNLIKRVRNSAKATFGDDSKEIEMLGGKTIRFRKVN